MGRPIFLLRARAASRLRELPRFNSALLPITPPPVRNPQLDTGCIIKQ